MLPAAVFTELSHRHTRTQLVPIVSWVGDHSWQVAGLYSLLFLILRHTAARDAAARSVSCCSRL